MSFNKEAFLKEAKEVLKKEGEADIKEFLEENAKTLHKVLNLYVKHLGNPLVTMVAGSINPILDGFIEDINKEDNV